MSLWSRLGNVFRSGRIESELDEELQFHFEERIRDLVATGMSREAATAQVARRFGNPLRWREQSRDVKLLPWFDSILRDIRLGLRMCGRTTVTVAAVVAVARARGVRSRILAGGRADSEAAARAQTGAADLLDCQHEHSGAARVRYVQRPALRQAS